MEDPEGFAVHYVGYDSFLDAIRPGASHIQAPRGDGVTETYRSLRYFIAHPLPVGHRHIRRPATRELKGIDRIHSTTNAPNRAERARGGLDGRADLWPGRLGVTRLGEKRCRRQR